MPKSFKFSADKGFAAILFLVGVLILSGVIVGGAFYIKQNFKEVAVLPTIQIPSQVAASPKATDTPIPTPTPIVWKTYNNTVYGFNLKYPAKGMIMGKEGYSEGECGNSILENDDNLGHHIRVDNFFEIKIIKWQENMESYLKSLGANNQYNVEPVLGSGADEAIKVVGLKKGFEIAVGYPSLMYVTNIYKKGDHIFSIVGLENPNKDWEGCKAALVLDPVAHDHLVVKDWDIAKSLKFN